MHIDRNRRDDADVLQDAYFTGSKAQRPIVSLRRRGGDTNQLEKSAAWSARAEAYRRNSPACRPLPGDTRHDHAQGTKHQTSYKDRKYFPHRLFLPNIF